MQIGPYNFSNNLVLAPMAGVTDRPFRQLCRQLGAGMVVSEMITSDVRLWNTDKSKHRLNHDGEVEPIVVQLAGADPKMMAQAAKLNVDNGAQIIDINMGCPAKKVCNKLAGSALLANEKLVAEILEATVNAVNVPITLKIRTGPDPQHKNGVFIATLAEKCGVQGLSVHGRTRACRFTGNAEYQTIKNIKQAVNIPVIANGDITSPKQAKKVLNETTADGIMLGRAAQGWPWIFREIEYFLTTNQHLPLPSAAEIRDVMVNHLLNLHDFYGEYRGVRIARKHISWYLKSQQNTLLLRQKLMKIEHASQQILVIKEYFNRKEELIAA